MPGRTGRASCCASSSSARPRCSRPAPRTPIRPWRCSIRRGIGPQPDPGQEAVGIVAPRVRLVAVAPATEPTDDTPWWDEAVEDSAEEPATEVDEARTGRFALGGFAVTEAHQAIAAVSFRTSLADAPTGIALGPADDAAPGTLVLEVEGTLNCAPEAVAVLMDGGFGPTRDGFTVSASASAPGPFAASGTFRVA